MILFALQKLRGCQMNLNFWSINPAMVVPHNLTPVYIKGATKQKCEIQRNLTNTVLSRWIKFIAGRTRADVSAIQVNAIVATPTVINQAFVDIWRNIMNVHKILNVDKYKQNTLNIRQLLGIFRFEWDDLEDEIKLLSISLAYSQKIYTPEKSLISLSFVFVFGFVFFTRRVCMVIFIEKLAKPSPSRSQNDKTSHRW